MCGYAHWPTAERRKLYWPVATAITFSMISRIRLVRRSMRITSLSRTTRSQYSGSRGNRWFQLNRQRFEVAFCKPGGNWPFLSKCFV